LFVKNLSGITKIATIEKIKINGANIIQKPGSIQ
jgi:hypothetical protein